MTTDEKKPRIPEFHGMYIKKSVTPALDGVQVPAVAQKDCEKTEKIADAGANGVHATCPPQINTTKVWPAFLFDSCSTMLVCVNLPIIQSEQPYIEDSTVEKGLETYIKLPQMFMRD